MEAYADSGAIEILIKSKDDNVMIDSFIFFKLGFNYSISKLKRIINFDTKVLERDSRTCFLNLD